MCDELSGFDIVLFVPPTPRYCESCRTIFTSQENGVPCKACQRVHYCSDGCMDKHMQLHNEPNRCDPTIPYDATYDETSEMIDALKHWLEPHATAISFFAFHCTLHSDGSNRNRFPVIVVDYTKDSLCLSDRVRCVKVFYVDITECRPHIAERICQLYRHPQVEGWPYAVVGLGGMWYANVSDAATNFICLPGSPRIRDWAPGLLAVLQRRWKFADVQREYRGLATSVYGPELALDCHSEGGGPGFRICDNSEIRRAALFDDVYCRTILKDTTDTTTA